ncbi:MAG TPA: hypothetical protein GX714_03695 [Chloroflexi bacterium]|jgi:hypothetical protein|nr:hypothetical protein [Chloroflexota bacterium]
MDRRAWRAVQIWMIIVIVGLGVVGAFGRVQAVEIVEGGTIAAGQTIEDDVFIGAENVLVEGTVTGDLFAVGGNVRINGTVEGSLFIAGQTLSVNGDVQGSVYVAGTGATLGAASRVGRNVYFAGYGLETQPGSQVQRDLVATGYQAVLAGRVERNVLASVAAMDFSGQAGGNVRADVAAPGTTGLMLVTPPGAPASIPLGIRVSEGAEIGGQLIYVSPERQDDAIRAELDEGIVFRTPEPGARQQAQRRDDRGIWFVVLRWIIARLRDLVTLLLLGALLLWLWPRWLYRAADALRDQPLLALGWGLVVWLVGLVGAAIVAVLIVLLAIMLGIITLGGLAFAVLGIGFSLLGLAFTIFWLSVSYLSKVVVAYLVGRWIVDSLSRREERPLEPVAPPGEVGAEPAPRRDIEGRSPAQDGWALVVGVVIYVVLRAIPILGWLIGAVVTLLGLGAMFMGLRDAWQERRGTRAA